MQLVNMAVCTRRWCSTVTQLRRLHRHLSWLPAAHNARYIGHTERVLSNLHRQLAGVPLQSFVTMSDVPPSMCTSPRESLGLCRESLSCSSPVEFLDQLRKESLQSWSPNEIADCIVQTGHCQMQSLCKSFPWLESSYHTAFLQLNLSDKLNEVSECIKEHSSFKELCRQLELSCEGCDDEHMAYALLMLVYIGVPPQDKLVHKLLYELRDRIPGMTSRSLSILARVCKAMPQLDTITVKKSIHRLKELLNEDRQWTFDEIDCLFVTATKHTRYLTFGGLCDQISMLITNYVHNEEYMSEPKRIGNLVSALRKLSGHISDYSCDFIETTVQIQKACLRHMDKFSYRDLDNVCDYLHYFQSSCTLKDFRNKCEERVLFLLEHATGIRELCNLLRTLSVDSPKHILAQLEDKIYENMEDMDLYIMSRIAKSFTTIGPEHLSDRITLKFQYLVTQRADLMTGYWTGMQYLIGLFSRRPFLDEDVKNQFVSSLMRYLKHVDYRWSETSTVLQVLVTISDYPGLPDPIFESILLGVQRWATPEVYHLINRINRASYKLTPKFMSQVKELLIVLYSRLLELVPGIPSLYYLTPLANKSIASHRNHCDVDPVVLEKIMDRINVLSSDRITEHGLGRLATILFKLQYFSPVLLDNMIKSALNLKTFRLKQTILSLLNLLQKVGYRPEEFDAFTEVAVNLYEQCACDGEHADMVCILSYLSSLQYFPLDQLRYVFSIEFLEQFDKEVSGVTKSPYKDRLMILNRNCVLECPELDVPWFHDDYCKEKYERKWSKRTHEMKVKPALEKVLGGPSYFNVNSASPYYYILDFECILDENKQPVPVNVKQIKDSWQRVAILLLSPNMYCLHSRRLSGASQVQLRHLEILGYKMVLIPHYEWNSMGLADFDAQCDYIRGKIFK